MIDFPTAPYVGLVYVSGGRSWQWSGAGWERVVNYGQNAAVLVAVTVVEAHAGGFDAAQVAPSFFLLNYV